MALLVFSVDLTVLTHPRSFNAKTIKYRFLNPSVFNPRAFPEIT